MKRPPVLKRSGPAWRPFISELSITSQTLCRDAQFGLVAEDVEKVNPDLMARDNEGKPYTIRYEAVNAMLLNEFRKEHRAFIEEQRKVEKLEAKVAQQHKDFAAAVAELKGQIQKVSAQLELSKPVTQTAANNR